MMTIMDDVISKGRSVSVGLAKFGTLDTVIKTLGCCPTVEELYTNDFVDEINLLIQEKK